MEGVVMDALDAARKVLKARGTPDFAICALNNAEVIACALLMTQAPQAPGEMTAEEAARDWLHRQFGSHSSRDIWSRLMPDDFTTLAKLISTRDAARDAARWQPIETAPRDGTRILVLVRAQTYLVSWKEYGTRDGVTTGWCGYDCDEDTWYSWGFDDGEPTHWQPVPSPPISPAPQEADTQ